MLAAGEVDAVIGTSYGTPINLREKGVPADDIATMLMASYGLELYGNSIVASARILAEKPDAVRGFVRGFLRGLRDTLADPAAAVDQVLQRGNGASRELELERLRIVIRDSIVTPETRSNGLGGIDAARFETAMNQLGTAFNFKSRPKLSDVFDSSFLPPEGERRVE
jgi:NitT/TauT family transport system substrate-binding protein